MKSIFLIIIGVLFIGLASAGNPSSILNNVEFHTHAFMTHLDKLGDSLSDITIQNTSADTTFTITGIFIQQLLQSNCTTSYFAHDGKLYGTMWSNDITLAPSATTALGAGYLYSMLMNYLYEASYNGGPAASTPGNTGAWCIQLGILQGGPTQYPTYSVTTNTTPSASLSNVVTWTNNTTPTPIAITCSDVTQTCTANASATQTFPL